MILPLSLCYLIVRVCYSTTLLRFVIQKHIRAHISLTRQFRSKCSRMVIDMCLSYPKKIISILQPNFRIVLISEFFSFCCFTKFLVAAALQPPCSRLTAALQLPILYTLLGGCRAAALHFINIFTKTYSHVEEQISITFWQIQVVKKSTLIMFNHIWIDENTTMLLKAKNQFSYRSRPTAALQPPYSRLIEINFYKVAVKRL